MQKVSLKMINGGQELKDTVDQTKAQLADNTNKIEILSNGTNEKFYEIFDSGDCYCCKIGEKDDNVPVIDYNQFKKYYQKNMQVNFDILKERVIDSLESTDLKFIRKELSKLSGPTLFSGVGGSSVVSEFGAKVINAKNGIVSINSEPRDFLYQNNKAFKNVISCSYSGNNYGVELSF